MSKWTNIAFSNIGKRERNQDFVYKEFIKIKQRKIAILLVCDGVGGRPSGELCSHEVGNEIVFKVKTYLIKRKTKRSLNRSDLYAIKCSISNIYELDAPKESRTTASLMLIDTKKTKYGYSCISIWAGDSRIYFLSEEAPPIQVSLDQYNEEGYLSTIFGGDGRLYGNLGVRFFKSKNPILFCVTSDGMNSKLEGLYKFFLACVYHKLDTDTEFELRATQYLSNIISDNYSSVLLYKRNASSRLLKVLKMI